MMTRVQELCRKLKPVLGQKIDRLWSAYLAESEMSGKADIEQTLELLAKKHLDQDYQPDRSPFPPPAKAFSRAGQIEAGTVCYGNRQLYPFRLKIDRLKEHLLIAGRSGSGKTNLTFVLMDRIMQQGVKVLALDWKRGYRDLIGLRKDLHVYTLGREVSPFRFNPLIPPPGCEGQVWIKLIVDVIAGAYLGGEGVISLLVAGLDHLYREAGVYDHTQTHWPTVIDLLAWLRKAKLKGRAAMWQASAERILLAMTYGEFGSVVNTQDNRHVQELLQHNVVLEMDGLSSASDRVMFSEALTLYLYRYRLGQGPQEKLTNLIVLEEAHNLLLKKATEARESVLETSIRMIRQYGMGYVFVDQSASLLSKVAFANSYATFALSQKLRADIQAISGAMNLTDEQRDALSTLPVGTAVVRLADEHPEPFSVKIPRCSIREGSVCDREIRQRMASYPSNSRANKPVGIRPEAVSPIPSHDKKNKNTRNTCNTHPPSPGQSGQEPEKTCTDAQTEPPQRTRKSLSREAIRFLADIAARPLSTTVLRYQRLTLSRRRGNAIRQQLAKAGLLDPVTIATRSGQVILYQLTELGRDMCQKQGIDPGPRPRASLEHRYWVKKTHQHFERQGYDVRCEHPIQGNGAIDLLAEKPAETIAIEIETGKSHIKTNLSNVIDAGFDRVVFLATSPEAVEACRRALNTFSETRQKTVELLTWLDVS